MPSSFSGQACILLIVAVDVLEDLFAFSWIVWACGKDSIAHLESEPTLIDQDGSHQTPLKTLLGYVPDCTANLIPHNGIDAESINLLSYCYGCLG